MKEIRKHKNCKNVGYSIDDKFDNTENKPKRVITQKRECDLVEALVSELTRRSFLEVETAEDGEDWVRVRLSSLNRLLSILHETPALAAAEKRSMKTKKDIRRRNREAVGCQGSLLSKACCAPRPSQS